MRKYEKNWENHEYWVSEYNGYLNYNLFEIEKSKKQQPNKKIPYFVIYCSIKDRLMSISNGALKLYLYIGFSANYKTGYFITSYDELVQDENLLVKTKRRLSSWINELKEACLILVKSVDSSLYIFLYPYDSDICYHNDDSIDTLSKKYSKWIEIHKIKGQDGKMYPFFFIPKIFMEKYWGRLSQLGSIKLYIYCGISMDKSFGYFYKSLPTISRELGVTRKTLILWFKELEENKLIVRHQLKLNASSCTHLLPIVK